MYHLFRKRLAEIDTDLEKLRKDFQYPITKEQIIRYLSDKGISLVETDRHIYQETCFSLPFAELKIEDDRIVVEYNFFSENKEFHEVKELANILYEVLFKSVLPKYITYLYLSTDKYKKYFVAEFLLPKDYLKQYLKEKDIVNLSECENHFKISRDLIKEQLEDFGIIRQGE